MRKPKKLLWKCMVYVKSVLVKETLVLKDYTYVRTSIFVTVENSGFDSPNHRSM